MSGWKIPGASRLFLPTYLGRMRTTVTNHEHGQDDAHISFPHLGVGGVTLDDLFISKNREASDNLYGAAAYFPHAFAADGDRNYIEFSYDSTPQHNLQVVANRMTCIKEYPYAGAPNSNMVILPASFGNFDELSFLHGNDGANKGQSGSTGVNGVTIPSSIILSRGYFGMGGVTLSETVARRASVHYFIHTEIIDGGSYTEPVKFITDPAKGCLAASNSSTSLGLASFDTTTGKRTSTRTIDRLWYENNDIFKCTRFYGGSALPTTCPGNGKMNAYFRFDIEPALGSAAGTYDSSGYIRFYAPSVGLDISGFTYSDNLPNARLRIEIEQAWMFAATRNHGNIFDPGELGNDPRFYGSIGYSAIPSFKSDAVKLMDLDELELRTYKFPEGAVLFLVPNPELTGVPQVTVTVRKYPAEPLPSGASWSGTSTSTTDIWPRTGKEIVSYTNSISGYSVNTDVEITYTIGPEGNQKTKHFEMTIFKNGASTVSVLRQPTADEMF